VSIEEARATGGEGEWGGIFPAFFYSWDQEKRNQEKRDFEQANNGKGGMERSGL